MATVNSTATTPSLMKTKPIKIRSRWPEIVSNGGTLSTATIWLSSIFQALILASKSSYRTVGRIIKTRRPPKQIDCYFRIKMKTLPTMLLQRKSNKLLRPAHSNPSRTPILRRWYQTLMSRQILSPWLVVIREARKRAIKSIQQHSQEPRLSLRCSRMWLVAANGASMVITSPRPSSSRTSCNSQWAECGSLRLAGPHTLTPRPPYRRSTAKTDASSKIRGILEKRRPRTNPQERWGL